MSRESKLTRDSVKLRAEHVGCRIIKELTQNSNSKPGQAHLGIIEKLLSQELNNNK